MLLRAAGWKMSPIHEAVESLELRAQDREEAAALARARALIRERRYSAEDVERIIAAAPASEPVAERRTKT